MQAQGMNGKYLCHHIPLVITEFQTGGKITRKVMEMTGHWEVPHEPHSPVEAVVC